MSKRDDAVFLYHILKKTENENKIIKRPGRICSREKEGILPFLHESLTIKSQG